MTGGEPTLGLACFAFPASICQCREIYSFTGETPGFPRSKFVNRSRAERCRSKVVNKWKKYLIELGGFGAANAIAGYKLFNVVVRNICFFLPLPVLRSRWSVPIARSRVRAGWSA